MLRYLAPPISLSDLMIRQIFPFPVFPSFSFVARSMYLSRWVRQPFPIIPTSFLRRCTTQYPFLVHSANLAVLALAPLW